MLVLAHITRGWNAMRGESSPEGSSRLSRFRRPDFPFFTVLFLFSYERDDWDDWDDSDNLSLSLRAIHDWERLLGIDAELPVAQFKSDSQKAV